MGKGEVAPPPGFVLDTPPPEGFVLDSPAVGAIQESPLLDRMISFIKEAGPDFLQNLAKGAVENLPAIGATGGAMAAALPGVATGPFAPAVVLGGAGAGGLGGAALKQILAPLVNLPTPATPEEASSERARSAADMMAAEMIGQPAAAGLSKVIAPFAARMTPEGKQVLRASKELNAPISPSAVVPSTPAKAMEKGSEGIITGKPMMNYQRQKTVKAINTEIARIQESVGAAGETELVGKAVKEGLGREEGGAISNFWAESKNLYDDFYKAANKGSAPAVDVNPLRQKMHEMLGPELQLPKGQQDAKLVEFIQDVLENQPKYLAPRQLHEIQKRLYDVGISDRGKVKVLKEAIDSAWEGYGQAIESDVLGALQKARGQFKEGMTELVENPLVKRLIKDESLPGSVRPGNVISQIYQPGNEKVVANLGKYLPAKTVEDMNARYLANFFDERSPIGQRVVKSVGLEKYIDGEALMKAVQAHKGILDATFDPKTVRALENLARLSKASMADMKALQNQGMGGLAQVLNLGAGGGAATSLLTGGGSGAAVGVAAGAIAAPGIARSLMAPNGILKAWLTEGLMRGPKGMMIRGAAKEGLKVGGRAVFQSDRSD